MSTKLQRPTSIAFLLLGLMALPLAPRAQGSVTFFVTNVDASKFPDVQFELRAVDLNNQVITNLNSANLSVYENAQLVPNSQVTPLTTDSPVNVIYVVDLGRQANYRSFGLNNIRLAITTLVSGGFFIDGLDTVQVLGRQNINSDQTTTLLRATNNAADLTNWAANFSFQAGSGPTKGLLGVEDAIKAMSDQVPIAGSQATVIIFITRYVEDPKSTVAVSAAESLAQTAQQQYVSIYPFQTDVSQRYRQPLELLATGTHGLYVPLQRSTVTTAVSNIYQTISAQRAKYIVAYRSQLGESGTRQITINAAEAPSSGVAGSYEVTVKPPAVTIVEPNPGSTMQREPNPSADGTTWTYEDMTVPVTAEIAWPDQTTPRAIRSAQLYVDGVLQDTVQPAPGDTQVKFAWNISDVVKEGPNPSKVEVQVTDELNVTAVGESTINIEVIPPPPPKVEDPLPALIGKYWVVVPIACVGLLLAFMASALVFYLTKPEQARRVLDEIQHTIIGGARGGQKVLATLKVIEGPKALIGETINITKETTTLGRNPQVADIVFYRNEESSVSRQHCTLQLDRNTFVLTDLNSSSGTRVNDESLRPNDPVPLRDGDEIVLGDLTQVGVKLRFGYLADKTEVLVDRTFIGDRAFRLDDWDEDKWKEDK